MPLQMQLRLIVTNLGNMPVVCGRQQICKKPCGQWRATPSTVTVAQITACKPQNSRNFVISIQSQRRKYIRNMFFYSKSYTEIRVLRLGIY